MHKTQMNEEQTREHARRIVDALNVMTQEHIPFIGTRAMAGILCTAAGQIAGECCPDPMQAIEDLSTALSVGMAHGCEIRAGKLKHESQGGTNEI